MLHPQLFEISAWPWLERLSRRENRLVTLADVSARIVELSSALPARVDPELAHFLQRCSFVKALVWLEEHAAADRASNSASR